MALTSGTTNLTDNFRTAVSELTDAPDLNNIADHERELRLEDLDRVRQMLVGTLSSDTVLSRLIVNSFTAALERNEAAEKAAKQSDDDQYFLALLRGLEAQIEALEREIEGYDNQIEALEDLIALEKDGKLDPNNPEHIRMLEAAGIPVDEWGTVTLEDLNKKLEEIKAKRDEAKEELDEKQTKKDSLDSKVTALASAEEPEKQALVKELKAEYKGQLDDFINSHPDLVEEEIPWFRAGFNLLDEGQPDYIQNVNRLIAELNPITKRELLQNINDLPEAVADQLRLDKFEQLYGAFSTKLRDKPNYMELLETKILGKLDDRTKLLLSQKESTPTEVAEILNRQSAENVNATIQPEVL